MSDPTERGAAAEYFWPVYYPDGGLAAAFRTRRMAREYAKRKGLRSAENWVHIV